MCWVGCERGNLEECESMGGRWHVNSKAVCPSATGLGGRGGSVALELGSEEL